MNYTEFRKYYERNIPDIKSLNYLNKVINNYGPDYAIISCLGKTIKRNAYSYLENGKVRFNDNYIRRKDFIYSEDIASAVNIKTHKLFKIFNDTNYALVRFTIHEELNDSQVNINDCLFPFFGLDNNFNNTNSTWYSDLVYSELMNFDIGGTSTSCRVSSLWTNESSLLGSGISLFYYNGLLNIGDSTKHIIIEGDAMLPYIDNEFTEYFIFFDKVRKRIYFGYIKDYTLYQNMLEFNYSLDDFYFFMNFIPIMTSGLYSPVNVGHIVYSFRFIDWISENKIIINDKLFILWLNNIKL